MSCLWIEIGGGDTCSEKRKSSTGCRCAFGVDDGFSSQLSEHELL